jgi:hypothetical protein
MLQFQFLPLPALPLSAREQFTADYKTPPVDFTIKLTAVGSPETDRGPPLS